MARPFRRTPGKTIDRKEWATIPGITLSSAASVGLLQGGRIDFMAPFTVLWSRGRFMVYFDETVQADDKAVVGMGLAVVSTDAAVLGATALPDPIGDPEYPWLYWTDFDLGSVETIASTWRAWGPAAREIIFDTKAMRKVSPGQSLQWLIEVADLTGNPTIEIIAGQTRVLLGS